MFGFFNKGNSAYDKLAYEFKFNGINGNLINFQSKVKERDKIILKNGVSEIT